MHTIEGLMGVSMEKIREMVDVNTIIGNPISTPDGTTIIPISKVSFGFASGGSDLPSKVTKDLFGGGAGAGVTIQPLGFLVCKDGDVKLLQMTINADTANGIINMVPDVVDKIGGFIKDKKNKKDED